MFTFKKALMAATITAIFLDTASAMDFMGPLETQVSYDGRWLSGDESPNQRENKIQFATPIHKSETDSSGVLFNAGHFYIDDSVIMDNGQNVPRDLSKLEAGIQYRRQLQERKSWGLRGTIGYAGDRPFLSSKDLTFSMAGHYSYPSTAKGHWVLMAYMSNNSALLDYVPIPGFLYIRHSATFSGMFGLPFSSLRWRPRKPWVLSASFFGPVFQSEAAYGERQSLQVFAAYAWQRQSYIPHQRQAEDDRLILREQKLSVGARKPIGNSLTGGLELGRSFSREAAISRGFLKDERASARISDAWFLALSLKSTL